MKIIVGYDGSEPARRAVERAGDLASSNGGSVVVVSTAEVHASGVHGAQPLDTDEVEERRAELDEAAAALKQRGVGYELVEGRGEPAEAIVQAAKDSGADLVVVGTSGKTGLKRALMGSVSTAVVHEAPCDVLVVR